MKRVLFLLLLIFCFTYVYGQDERKELDFIIMIDEDIAIGSISQLQIKIVSDDKEDILEANYYPGNLSIKQPDYGRLLSAHTKAIFLKFAYSVHDDKNQEIYHYEIELRKPWLEDYFNVLRIYNLNKKKYGKLFASVSKGRKYVYELDSPSHTFHLIRSK